MGSGHWQYIVITWWWLQSSISGLSKKSNVNIFTKKYALCGDRNLHSAHIHFNKKNDFLFVPHIFETVHLIKWNDKNIFSFSTRTLYKSHNLLSPSHTNERHWQCKNKLSSDSELTVTHTNWYIDKRLTTTNYALNGLIFPLPTCS